MKAVYPRLELLANWALVGVLVLLCAPWVLSSNKLYHQLLIFLLWLPGLLALGRIEFRRLLLQPELILFLFLAAWTLLVVAIQNGKDGLGDAKLPFYVLLSLLGVLVAAQQRQCSIEWLLQVAVLIAGPFALWSVIDFYLLAGNAVSRRVVAVGLWDKVIMAAHAVGALAVLGCLLSLRLRQTWRWPLALLVLFALALFLLLSQTRGVWGALVAALVVSVLVRPSRPGVAVLGLCALGVLLLALFVPDFLTQRGLSHRPELLWKGLALFAEHWKLGLAFSSYGITVDSLGSTFKHPHNLYLDMGIRWGVLGLVLFMMLWSCVAWRAWCNRRSDLGCALLALWTFSSVSMLTDGIGLWIKPNADWLITWLPIAISIVLAARQKSSVAGADKTATL